MANRWAHQDRNSPATQARRRKYNTREHRDYRKATQAQIDRGVPTYCWRPNCRRRLYGHAWHVGHDDIQVNLIRGAECIGCNLSAAGRKGNRIQAIKHPELRRRVRTRRAW